MKSITIAACALLFITSACNNAADTKTTTTDTSAKKPDSTTTAVNTPAPMPDSATMMKNWQSYMTPGAMHKMMASWSGTWEAEITMWSQPGAPPSQSTGISVNKMIMNGLYMQSNHKSKMMGMPFEGMETVAYDNHKKMFVSTWIDNMGSGIMQMEGTWDDATKTITFNGKMMDPATAHETTERETFQIVDNNTQMVTMYGTGPDGKEFKTMEIKFTRSK